MSANKALIFCLLTLLVGCSNNQPTQNAKSREEWNSARGAVLASLARQQYDAGNFDNCRKSLDDAAKLDPKNAQVHLLSARLFIEQGALEPAENELTTVRQLDEKNAEANYLSGIIYQRWQKPQIAFEAYTRACELEPAELAYLLARAEMLVSLNRTGEALDLLQAKVVYFENSAAIRDAVGQLLVQQGKYAQAADMLRQANILTPEEPVIREHLALALVRAGQYPDAAALISKMVQEERFAKRVDLWVALGDSDLQIGRPRDAREAYESAAQLDPNSASILRDLAKVAIVLNDFKRADLSLRKSISLDPQSAESQLALGYLRLKQNQDDQALAAFKKAVTLDGSDTVALCMVGYVLEKTGHGADAMTWYARALKQKPRDELANKLMSQVQINE